MHRCSTHIDGVGLDTCPRDQKLRHLSGDGATPPALSGLSDRLAGRQAPSSAAVRTIASMVRRARFETLRADRGVYYNFTLVSTALSAIEHHQCNAQWVLAEGANSSSTSTHQAEPYLHALRAVAGAFDLVQIPLMLWRSSARAWRQGCDMDVSTSIELFAPADYLMGEAHFDLLVVS